jgi:hypothetical protein
MTQYMLSVHDDPSTPFPEGEAMQKIFDDVDAFNQKLQREGLWVFGGGLQPVETATVVDGRGGEVLMVDGPYLESKEYLGGFWIIEAPDLDAALKLAAEGSRACAGRVEVRPFQDEPGA